MQRPVELADLSPGFRPTLLERFDVLAKPGSPLASRLAGEQEQAGRELASTGFNLGGLALIGALCVAASILLFRRRKTA